MTTFDPNSFLIPITLATGASTAQEATLMLAYRGAGAIFDPRTKRSYLRLPDAIRWNEVEADDGGPAEREFRYALLKQLKAISSQDAKLVYTDELMALRRKAFGT